MRSTFAGLNTLVRGINANQLSENTVGHNISNANTEGYSRQSVNLAAVDARKEASIYGNVLVGQGVDSTSLTRARDIYADRQYWSENSTSAYYTSRAKEYDKIEAIFNDTTLENIQDSIQDFYKAWSSLSANASDSSTRITVVEKGKVFADRIHTAAQKMQEQIDANYKDMELNITRINDYTDQIVQLNRSIMSTEATGGMANDLRDQRDLLVDKLSSFVNLNIYEDSNGMYSVVSNGVSLVNGINKLTLELSDPIANDTYGINDYTVLLKESGIAYQPTNGTLKAQMDQIEEDKAYIDYLAKMSAFMLTTFNHQHQQGIGIDSAACTATYGTEDFDDTSPTYGEINDSGSKVVTAAGTDLTGTSGVNFYGAADVIYTWDEATQTVTATKYSAGWHMVVSTYEKEEAGLINYYSKATVKENTGSTQTAETLKAIDIIKALELNAQLTAENGQNLVAARTWGTTTTSVDPTTHVAKDLGTHVAEANGSGDGTNAVDLSTLFNMNQENTQIDFIAKQFTGNQQTGTDRRSMGTISLEAYYNQRMTALGSDAETMDSKVKAQNEVLVQVEEWRQSVSAVNWNEELTNMIMFQQGYSACSRCLTTMDEMLDRLINSTGTVGR
ncbi:flagellar hook-associated protein FlgK [Selenomonas sp. KH1T6]|uniref:flagellar hook-associated protein FlgK n=1 Tax=Selenomonas sp. KH1T6 TaxID=3158784 RepID=UPI0008A763C4|nr:flagellar hook-associated protein 1 FlgK [Selenomonas ruminantium]